MNKENEPLLINCNYKKNGNRKKWISMCILISILLVAIVLILSLSITLTSTQIGAYSPSMIGVWLYKFDGKISSHDNKDLSYQFEYQLDGDIYYMFTNSSSFDEKSGYVSQIAENLINDKTYMYRLILLSESGSKIGESNKISFKTLQFPIIEMIGVVNNKTNPGSVLCYGNINNTGSSILYYFFEYKIDGTKDFYATPQYLINNQFGLSTVAQEIQNLSINTRYEFKVAITEKYQQITSAIYESLSTFILVQ